MNHYTLALRCDLCRTHFSPVFRGLGWLQLFRDFFCIRRVARKRGWMRERGKDMCGACAQKVGK